MKLYATALLLAAAAMPLFAAACDKNDATSTTHTTGATLPSEYARPTIKDNATTLTSLDQGETPAELAATQAIRQAIMADDSLSWEAKNVMVVTNNGVITLRGLVKTAAEEEDIKLKAQRVAASYTVVDQLEVEPSK